eukprot:gnl/TRDRNA2_/TRDRNA2_137459_c0_seq2.p1 gnl/TRDRNA2_/TRDRNA2_137459_c0~~gnl/TRDRNA2_/TRDRNA2_137459_c0_seq2.p1  ORF type:complete len:203 (+),score=28.52 gnl/TRDRNA2_/TRDRNA2_137459_c0_seq2:49-657(+)
MLYRPVVEVAIPDDDDDQDLHLSEAPTSGPRLWTLVSGLAGEPWWLTLGTAGGQGIDAEARAVTGSVMSHLKALLPFDEPPLDKVTEDDFAHLVGQIRMNAVEAIVPYMNEDESFKDEVEVPSAVGIALHLVASAVNHSCSPSCTLQTGLALPSLRGWAVLQAARSFAEGEEATIAYVPPGPNRHRELLEQWCFDCDCGNCE